MFNKYLAIFIFIFLLLSMKSFSYADKEAMPYSYITTSSNGNYYFRMSPDIADPKDQRKGFGFAHEVTSQNDEKIIWSTKDWYAFSTFLSNDGVFLVRIGNWPRGPNPSKEHLAIAFYKEGRLLKSYSTQDLIHGDFSIVSSASHYKFLKENNAPRFINDHIFQIVTVEGTEYNFDIRTGNILNKK